MNGAYPISGDKCLLKFSGSSSSFEINFNQPQAVLGMYIVDLEIAELTITLYTPQNESTIVTIPHTQPLPNQSISGSVIFFGVIDISKPFSRAVHKYHDCG